MPDAAGRFPETRFVAGVVQKFTGGGESAEELQQPLLLLAVDPVSGAELSNGPDLGQRIMLDICRLYAFHGCILPDQRYRHALATNEK
jgi:hypothetical protein